MPYRGYPDVFPLSSLRNLRLDWFFDTQTQKQNVPPGKPDGQLVKKSLRVFCQAAFKIAKLFVVLFCNFAAAAGDGTRKETLTVSLYYRVVVFIAPIQGLCYTVRDAVDWFRFPTARRFLKGSNHSPLQYC